MISETHTSESLRQLQLSDPMIGPLLRSIESDTPIATAEASKAARRLCQIREQLMVHGGVLCRQFRPKEATKTTLQLVIPAALQEEIIADIHEGVVGGHLGVDKTLFRLRERYYWPGHYNAVREWCQKCAVCASRKTPAPKARAPLQPILTSCPLELVATDIMGPLPESHNGNRYILVISDYFTRYTEAYAIPNQEAVTVARKLVDEFFLRFSPPERLHSDQGRNFESALIAEICQLLGVKKCRTTPYHPQSDGLVERFNRTLLNMLATAVGDKPFDWERNLRRLCFAYNTSIHPTTGYSPFSLMFGRQARLPTDITLGTHSSQSNTVQHYSEQLKQDLRAAYSYVCDHMGHKLQDQKTYYDNRVEGKPFEKDDLVWLHNSAVPRGKSRKLHRPWTGPFRVVTRVADSVYRLQHTRHPRRRVVVHFNRLKKCPHDIRLPTGSSQEDRNQTRLVEQSHTCAGTQIELLESEETDTADAEAENNLQIDQPTNFELPNTQSPVPSPLPSHPVSPTPPSSFTSSPTPPPPVPTSRARRYPHRDRAAPERLFPVVSH